MYLFTTCVGEINFRLILYMIGTDLSCKATVVVIVMCCLQDVVYCRLRDRLLCGVGL